MNKYKINTMKKKYILISLMFIATSSFSQWTQLTSGTSSQLNSVFFTDVNTGYVVGSYGLILKTDDGGLSWSQQNSDSTIISLYSICFTDANTGYAVGGQGTILKTVNGGTNWIIQTIGSTCTLYSVCFTDFNNGYAVGSNGVIIKTTNAGINWTTYSFNASTNLNSVYFTDSNNGYAVGSSYCQLLQTQSAIIYSTNDGGINWSGNFPFMCSIAAFNSVYFTNTNTGYIVGGNNMQGVFNTTNGFSFGLQSGWLTYGLSSIFFTNIDTGYVAGSGIFKTINAGNTWEQQTSVGINSIFFTDANTGYAVGSNGTILKTANGGGTLSVKENQLAESSINIFPNPTNNNLTIETSKKVTIEILDLERQIIKRITADGNQSTIDISALAKGMYFIKVTTEKEIITKKFIKE